MFVAHHERGFLTLHDAEGSVCFIGVVKLTKVSGIPVQIARMKVEAVLRGELMFELDRAAVAFEIVVGAPAIIVLVGEFGGVAAVPPCAVLDGLLSPSSVAGNGCFRHNTEAITFEELRVFLFGNGL